MSPIFGHGGSGSPLDFGSSAASDMRVRMVPKLCETCLRTYTRLSTTDPRLRGECGICEKRRKDLEAAN